MRNALADSCRGIAYAANLLLMSTLPSAPAADNLQAVVAAEIRAWMGRRNVRQSHLAQTLGITQSQFSKRMRGTIPLDILELEKIATYLQVDPAVLLGGIENPHPTNPSQASQHTNTGTDQRTRPYQHGLRAVA